MAKYKRVQQGMEKQREAGLHAILAGAVVLEREYKLMLSKEGKGGGPRWKPAKGQKYRPSKPGQPPTVQTGHLRRSIGIDVGQLDSRGTVNVGSNVKYARHLEFGTRHMKARPWMRPTISNARVRRVIMQAQQREYARRMA